MAASSTPCVPTSVDSQELTPLAREFARILNEAFDLEEELAESVAETLAAAAAKNVDREPAPAQRPKKKRSNPYAEFISWLNPVYKDEKTFENELTLAEPSSEKGKALFEELGLKVGDKMGFSELVAHTRETTTNLMRTAGLVWASMSTDRDSYKYWIPV